MTRTKLSTNEVKLKEYIRNNWKIEISDKILYYIIHIEQIDMIKDQDLKSIIEEVTPIRKTIFKSLDGSYEAQQTALFIFLLENKR